MGNQLQSSGAGTSSGEELTIGWCGPIICSSVKSSTSSRARRRASSKLLCSSMAEPRDHSENMLQAKRLPCKCESRLARLPVIPRNDEGRNRGRNQGVAGHTSGLSTVSWRCGAVSASPHPTFPETAWRLSRDHVGTGGRVFRRRSVPARQGDGTPPHPPLAPLGDTDMNISYRRKRQAPKLLQKNLQISCARRPERGFVAGDDKPATADSVRCPAKMH